MNLEAVKKSRRSRGFSELHPDEITALTNEAKKAGAGLAYDLTLLVYVYSFMRGKNAERNKQKKQKRIEDEGKWGRKT